MAKRPVAGTAPGGAQTSAGAAAAPPPAAALAAPRRRRRDLPGRLPVLPLINTVVFPRMTVPLLVDVPASVAALRAAEARGPLILLVAQRDENLRTVAPGDLYAMGTVAQIMQAIRVPDGGMQVVVQGLIRARVTECAVVAGPAGAAGAAGAGAAGAAHETRRKRSPAFVPVSTAFAFASRGLAPKHSTRWERSSVGRVRAQAPRFG